MPELRFVPVTRGRLADLRAFATEYGKFGYCACMRWRMRSTAFQRSSKPARQAALERLVAEEQPVGVLAYADARPVAWCSVAPRETYAGLERHQALGRVDDAPVWSVVCFFVAPGQRRQGLTGHLLRAAVAYAVAQGARIVEGYPVEPTARSYTYMGSPRVFHLAGFVDVTPPGRERKVMRYFAAQDTTSGGEAEPERL